MQEIGRVDGGEFLVDSYKIEGTEGEGFGRLIVLQVCRRLVLRLGRLGAVGDVTL